MTKKSDLELATDLGDVIPTISPETDVGKLQALMEWARVRGFEIGPVVRIGGVTLQIRDLRQVEARESKRATEPDMGIFERNMPPEH